VEGLKLLIPNDKG